MTRLILVVALALAAARPAHADDRAAIGDSLAKLASTAEALARTAGSSDDRAVRKKLAPKATELGIDLAALSRRAHKDVPLKAIANDARAIAKDTAQLVELTDEAEDKTERKALRAQAMLLDQQVAATRKQIDDAAAAKPAAAPRVPLAPDVFKHLVDATEAANTDAQKLDVIAAAAASWFTAAQVGALMDLIGTEAVKVNVASTLWPRLVDAQNGFAIYAKLELAGSKAELKRRVGR